MDEMTTVVVAVLRPFGVVAVGYLLQRLRKIDTAPLVDVAMYVAVPALAFHALVSHEIPATHAGAVAIVAAYACSGIGRVVALSEPKVQPRTRVRAD